MPLVSAEHRSEFGCPAHIQCVRCPQPAGSMLSRLKPLSWWPQSHLERLLVCFFFFIKQKPAPSGAPIHFPEQAICLELLFTQYFHRLGIKLPFHSLLSFSSPLDTQQSLIWNFLWKSKCFNGSRQRDFPSPTQESEPPCWRLTCPPEGRGVGLAPGSHLSSRSYRGAVACGPSYRETAHTRNILQLSWRNVVSGLEMNLINGFSY